MFRVHLAHGETLSFDLQSEEDLKRWRGLRRDHAFQSSVRGISVLIEGGALQSVPVPRGFHRVAMDMEVLLDDENVPAQARIIMYVDQMQLTHTVYLNGAKGQPGRCRVDLIRKGRLMHFPDGS